MTVYLHIGLHKTGSSSLQIFLNANRERLAQVGMIYPKAGWVNGAHHNLGYQLMGNSHYSTAHGSLREALAEMDRGRNGVLSTEEFEFLSLKQIQRLKEHLGRRQARVIVYLRRQDELISSAYTQETKRGVALGEWSQYIQTALSMRRFDLLHVLNCWSEVFGAHNILAGVISEEIDGRDLPIDFAGKLGLGQATAGLKVAAARANPSPTHMELRLIQGVHKLLYPTGGHVFSDVEYRTVSTAVRSRLEAEGCDTGARLSFSKDDYAALRKRFQAANNLLGQTYVPSGKQRAALKFGAAPTPGIAQPEAAAVQNLARQVVGALKEGQIA